MQAQTTLIAHWTFDESSGPTAHDSTGSFDGTLSGTAAFVAGGISGNALSLDGATTSFVSMGTSVPGFTTDDFSLAAWVKTTTAASTALVAGKHYAGSLDGYFIFLNGSSGYGAAGKGYFYDSTNPGGVVTSTTTVTDGNWHQLIGVYTAGGNIQLYVDGVSQGTTSS